MITHNTPSFLATSNIYSPNSHPLLNSNTPLFAMSWNIRSMSRNSDELKILITRHNPTIVAYQEIMTIPNQNNSPFNNYSWYFNQTPTNMHHSVSIGIQKHIPSNHINISTNIPAIAVKIPSPIEFTIVSLNFSPSLSPLSIVAQEIETLLPQLQMGMLSSLLNIPVNMPQNTIILTLSYAYTIYL